MQMNWSRKRAAPFQNSTQHVRCVYFVNINIVSSWALLPTGFLNKVLLLLRAFSKVSQYTKSPRIEIKTLSISDNGAVANTERHEMSHDLRKLGFGVYEQV